MTDELYHSGRKGMKWYQHIFGDEAQQRRRAKRMKKNADKVARIKEKIRIAEESNKLKQMKADAKKKLKETKGETSKIKKLKKEDIKKQIEEKKAETEKAKKTTGPVAPQTSARAIARSMGGMSDEEVKKHLQRLTAEKSIRQLAAEEAKKEMADRPRYRTFCPAGRLCHSADSRPVFKGLASQDNVDHFRALSDCSVRPQS